MSESTSAYRLPVPAHQAYDTSPGEQMVLRGLDANNLGALYGVLMNQRALAAASQQQYRGDLDASTRAQRQISGAKLINDDRDSQRKAVLGLVQHGNLPSSVAMNGMSLDGLPAFLSEQQAAHSTIDTDSRRGAMESSKALADAGAGTYSAAQAGVLPTPGQAVAPGAAGLVGLRRDVGTPLSLSAASIRAAAAGAGSGGIRYDSTVDEFGTTQHRVRALDPQALLEGERLLRDARTNRVNDNVRRDGGNITPQGVQPPGGSPTGPAAGASRVATPPRASITAPLTEDESSRLRALSLRYGTYEGYRRTGDGKLLGKYNGRFVEVPTQ